MPGPVHSPVRLLAKSYTKHFITREEYIKIRSKLFRKLQFNGKIEDSDINNLISITKDIDAPKLKKSHSASDWVIIILGLIAFLVIIFFLYE